MYGIPLKVAPPDMKSEDKIEIRELKKRKDALKHQFRHIGEEKRRFETISKKS